jgi:hypothetical protein
VQKTKVTRRLPNGFDDCIVCEEYHFLMAGQSQFVRNILMSEDIRYR